MLELRHLLYIAGPVSLSTLARTAMMVTDLAFVGHLGADELAAAALASVFMEITSAFVWRGFGTTLNTLCAQARGAGNSTLVSAWLQMGLVLSTVTALPIMVAWWFTGDVLRAVGTREAIAELGQQYSRYSCGLVWPMLIYSAMASFLQVRITGAQSTRALSRNEHPSRRARARYCPTW
jgi:MATE family multidrug resistance protein